MQNHFPLWKNLMVLIVFIIGIIYALPNLFGNDPSVQLASSATTKLKQKQADGIKAELDKAGLSIKEFEFKNNKVLVRFNNTDDQLKASDLLKEKMGNDVTVALNLAPATPTWLRALNANPMYLGLDLRGGVHFLLEVDMNAAVKQAEER